MAKQVRLFLSLTLLFFLTALRPLWAMPPQQPLLPTTTLRIRPQDVSGVELVYHHSSFESSHTEFDLNVDGNLLTDGENNVPLTKLQPLLKSLHDLYPGTRPLTWVTWTDDYPFARVSLTLLDGRKIYLSSTSQFGKLVPWNVQVWNTGIDGRESISQSYFILHDEVHTALSVLWNELTGYDFSRDYTADETFSRWDEEKPPTVEFYVPEQYDNMYPWANEVDILTSPREMLAPFEKLLAGNKTLQTMFGSGYTLFDAAFNVQVDTQTIRPVQYEGTIALRAPDGPDVIATTATIALKPSFEVTTELDLAKVERSLQARRGSAFLEEIPHIFSGAVFLIDLRDLRSDLVPSFQCTSNPIHMQVDETFQALLPEQGDSRISLFHLKKLTAWTVEASFDRDSGYWDEELIGNIIKNWFPPSLTGIDPKDLYGFSTYFWISYLPDVTDTHPEYIQLLRRSLPPETRVHVEHPQKVGDRTYVAFDGRLILPEDGSPSRLVYCDITLPDWVKKYDTTSVKTPSRIKVHKPSQVDIGETPELAVHPEKKVGWIKLNNLRSTLRESDWFVISPSKPGYLHLLRTADDGVYYSEGWADGSDWIEAVRLGDSSWNMDIAANSAGEVHLIWSTDYYRDIGSMHVWKEALGDWQAPQVWKGAGYFSQVLLDSWGRLHLAWSHSDGLDEEFFYAVWSEESGLSQPENISRRLGGIGNYPIKLALDSSDQVHAAWGHAMSDSQFIDPLSGEVFDQAGVFYSRRLTDGTWTLPEQVGTFGEFAYDMDFTFTSQGDPLVIWQSQEGIATSVRQSERWSTPILLAKVEPPEQPAEFGPDRWGTPTADIELTTDLNGLIYLAWVIEQEGLYLMTYDSNGWGKPAHLDNTPGLRNLEIAITQDKNVYIIVYKPNEGDNYFSCNGQYQVIIWNQELADKRPISNCFLGYGSDGAQLQVDSLGFVYVNAFPHQPEISVFIPSSGIPPTPTFTPRLTATPKPSATPSPEPTQTETPIGQSITINRPYGSTSLFLAVILLASLYLAMRAMALPQKR